MPLFHRAAYSIIICDECGREERTGLYSLDDLSYWMDVHGWTDRQIVGETDRKDVRR